MSSLYLLQYTCLLVFAMQVLLLVVSRFQMSVVNRQYEKSRWSLVAADVLLVTHYALQMACGFRAHSDDAGLIVNILFYPPRQLPGGPFRTQYGVRKASSPSLRLVVCPNVCSHTRYI